MNEPSSNQNRSQVVELTNSTVATPALNDCWDKIGVNGDHTCLELEKHIHCRNCPVYAGAALQLLNRSLPAEQRREWSEHYARPKSVSILGKISVVVFRVGNEWLALPTQAFQEIAERRPIHSLPNRRQGNLLGIINVRGELLVCVSLGRLLGIPAQGFKNRQVPNVYDRLVVASWNGRRLVFPVEEVDGIQRLQPVDLKEPPATIAQPSGFTAGIFGWQDKTVGVLDAEMVFAALNRSLS